MATSNCDSIDNDFTMHLLYDLVFVSFYCFAKNIACLLYLFAVPQNIFLMYQQKVKSHQCKTEFL